MCTSSLLRRNWKACISHVSSGDHVLWFVAVMVLSNLDVHVRLLHVHYCATCACARSTCTCLCATCRCTGSCSGKYRQILSSLMSLSLMILVNNYTDFTQQHFVNSVFVNDSLQSFWQLLMYCMYSSFVVLQSGMCVNKILMHNKWWERVLYYADSHCLAVRCKVSVTPIS